MSAPISPPIGGKKRGRPRKSDSLATLAKVAQVSLRTLERAVFVRRYGIPALIAMIERGELALDPAVFIAKYPHALQHEIVDGGASQARFIVKVLRRESQRGADE